MMGHYKNHHEDSILASYFVFKIELHFLKWRLLGFELFYLKDELKTKERSGQIEHCILERHI